MSNKRVRTRKMFHRSGSDDLYHYCTDPDPRNENASDPDPQPTSLLIQGGQLNMAVFSGTS